MCFPWVCSGKLSPIESGRTEWRHQKCPRCGFRRGKSYGQQDGGGKQSWKADVGTEGWPLFFQVAACCQPDVLWWDSGYKKWVSPKFQKPQSRQKWTMKKPWLLGITINHYKGPYEPSSISWDITGVSSLLNRLAYVFNLAQLGCWWRFQVATSKKSSQWSRKRRCEWKACLSLLVRVFFYILACDIHQLLGGVNQLSITTQHLETFKNFGVWDPISLKMSRNRSLSSETSH